MVKDIARTAFAGQAEKPAICIAARSFTSSPMIADLGQIDASRGCKFTQSGRLVAAALEHVSDVHFCGVTVDQGAVFAGDESEFNAGSPRQRNSHNVGEAETLPLFAIRAPPERRHR